jgi:uncharacterized protein (DUF1330 family)
MILRGILLTLPFSCPVLEGPDQSIASIVIEFPALEQCVACFTSPEYDKAAAFRRRGAGEVETIMVEGV